MRKPTTPPVRKAMPIAVSRPPGSPAAAATRRFARVASAMPAPPMNELKTAPTMKNSDRPILTADLVVGVVHRQQEQQDDGDDDEDRQRLELAEQVRRRAFLHGAGDLLHVLGAPAGGEHRLGRTAAAKPSATSAKTSATMTNVTFEPLRDTPPPRRELWRSRTSMSSCTPTAPGRRTRPARAHPRHRGDDNWVPRTRDQEQ